MILSANGLAFTADVAGPAGGDLVLLLHGFPQLSSCLGRGDAHPDRRRLPRPEPPTSAAIPPARGQGVHAKLRLDRLGGDVLALADAVSLDRIHLLGHDWGGQLAWIVAAQNPERVRTLSVLSRPHPAAFARAMSGDPQQATRSKHHRGFQRAEATDELLADGAARLRGVLRAQGVPDADVAAYLATLGERAALDAAIHWYRAAGRSGLTAADVPAVAVPTLYVWGDADATVGRRCRGGDARVREGAVPVRRGSRGRALRDGSGAGRCSRRYCSRTSRVTSRCSRAPRGRRSTPC